MPESQEIHIQRGQNPDLYNVLHIDQPPAPNFRVYLRKGEEELVSPWHDVPLYADETKKVLNMVVGTPRFGNAKMEVAKDEFLNPLRQDAKYGKPRYIPNIFPYKGCPWNYGTFPQSPSNETRRRKAQTWEDPSTIDGETLLCGDNNMLGVCDIGAELASAGQVKQVKVLGAMALLEEGKTNWKVIVIDVKDPLAKRLNCVADVVNSLPGYLDTMKYWFTVYGVPDGRPRNQIAFGGEIMEEGFAMQLIQRFHRRWETLVQEQQSILKPEFAGIGVQDPEPASNIASEATLPTNKFLHLSGPGIDKSHFLPTYQEDLGWSRAIYSVDNPVCKYLEL